MRPGGLPARARSRAALAAALMIGACSRGPEPIHVRSVSLADGPLSPALREAGLDESTVDAAAREALRAAGFELGDGSRPHHARVSIPSVRWAAGSSAGGPRAEVTVEITLAPAEQGQGALRRDAATASVALAGAPTPREAWRRALAEAARQAAKAHGVAVASEGKKTEALVANLSDEDPRVREHAIRVLGERRSRAAVPALIGRLGSEEPRVVHRVAAALAQIGDERAVPALIDLSRSDDPVFAGRIVRYVGDIGGVEAEGYLLTVESGHPDRRIRAAAREALEEMRARAKEAAVAARK